jgi:hypothetical protein
MNMVDFVKPDGTRVMRTIADYRQLNDALFHAGLRTGTSFEWTDEPNRLHFYAVDVRRDARGVLSYVLGLRSLDGRGPRSRGVTASAPQSLSVSASTGRWDVRVTNTGAAPTEVPATTHPGAPSGTFASDIYRVAVSVEGTGWQAEISNALLAIPAGASATLPVYIGRAAAASSGRVSVTVTSESDPAQKTTVTTNLRR